MRQYRKASISGKLLHFMTEARLGLQDDVECQFWTQLLHQAACESGVDTRLRKNAKLCLRCQKRELKESTHRG